MEDDEKGMNSCCVVGLVVFCFYGPYSTTNYVFRVIYVTYSKTGKRIRLITTMAPSKLSNLGNALYHVIFLLSMNEPCPIASFSPSVTPKNARSFPLTAYINPDGGGSNLGGRESLRNNTISEVAFVQTAINIEIDDKDSDIVGPGTLGDIMAGSSASDNAGRNNNANAILSQTAVIDGLVTKEGGELNAKFGCRFSPMERIALTANGNLQRIFSSYYDAPVHVHVDSCTRREGVPRENTNPQTVLDGFAFRIDTNGAVWDRVVHLYVHETVSSFPHQLYFVFFFCLFELS